MKFYWLWFKWSVWNACAEWSEFAIGYTRPGVTRWWYPFGWLWWFADGEVIMTTDEMDELDDMEKVGGSY